MFTLLAHNIEVKEENEEQNLVGLKLKGMSRVTLCAYFNFILNSDKKNCHFSICLQGERGSTPCTVINPLKNCQQVIFRVGVVMVYLLDTYEL
jgi:hypothetical protein